MVEDVHGVADGPDVGCLARITIRSGIQMFRPSEAGRASGKVRDIVSTSIPNSGEIDNFNFISVVVGATTEQIVDLDVPVGNLKLMHVPDGLANFNEDDPGDIRYVICLVLVGDIVDYSRTPDILLLLFDP
jgi:hypothetical protein